MSTPPSAPGTADLESDASRTALVPPFPDMVWIPGGTFRMGSDKDYPEERPAHRVTVDGFWMDRFPVTNARFGSRSARHQELVALGEGRTLASAIRARHLDRRAGAAPGRARFLFGCRSLRAVGGQDHPPPKPNGSSPPAAGSTAHRSPGATSSCRATATWPTRGKASFPGRGPAIGTSPNIPPTLPRHAASRSTTRPASRRQLRSSPAADPDSPQGPEGRLASLRAQLLPAVPSSRALSGTDRHLDLPRRLSMHRPA